MSEDTQEAQLAIDAILRNDFESFLHKSVRYLNPGTSFLPNWHIQAIAYQLDRIRRGEITRLIINMPPRHLKSLTVSVAFTAYRRRPCSQRSLPVALVVVDDSEAAGLVPSYLEDLLAVDADPKSRKLVGPSVRAERCGQLDRDAIILELAKLDASTSRDAFTRRRGRQAHPWRIH
jgi:hypothetical protein